MDAARVLPYVGLFLFMLPLFWSGGDEGASTSRGAIYLFLAWFGLIAAAFLLARRLKRIDPEEGG